MNLTKSLLTLLRTLNSFNLYFFNFNSKYNNSINLLENVNKITLFKYLMIMVLLQIYTRISETKIGNWKFAQCCHNNNNTVTNFYYLIENILKTTRQGC